MTLKELKSFAGKNGLLKIQDEKDSQTGSKACKAQRN